MWKLLDEQGEMRGKVGEREHWGECTEPTRRAGEGGASESVAHVEWIVGEVGGARNRRGNKSWGRVRKGFRPGSSSRGRTVGGGRRCCLWFGWFGAAGDRASRCIRVG